MDMRYALQVKNSNQHAKFNFKIMAALYGRVCKHSRSLRPGGMNWFPGGSPGRARTTAAKTATVTS